MSISTFSGIQTSLRGLLAQQRSLDVTSHNIANASTVGYTRQEATLAASTPLSVTTSGGANAGALGTGVDVQSYRRVRDQFLDLQYRGQSMSLGEQSAARTRCRRPSCRSPSPATTASPTRSRSSGARGATSPTAPRARRPAR